ncbi:hypothetical protein [Micromonospora sp. DT47]|uniref:hypothetical protein n=1 Tax=Micromonospora sp. DT47 TaxID=3393431 RepID=UPI003CF8945D
MDTGSRTGDRVRTVGAAARHRGGTAGTRAGALGAGTASRMWAVVFRPPGGTVGPGRARAGRYGRARTGGSARRPGLARTRHRLGPWAWHRRLAAPAGATRRGRSAAGGATVAARGVRVRWHGGPAGRGRPVDRRNGGIGV